MALRERYQTEIQLDTLYEVRASGRGAEQVSPSIWADAGTIDVYISNSATAPASAPAGMQIITNGENLEGVGSFAVIPNFLYIDQNSGATTELVLSGIEAVEVV